MFVVRNLLRVIMRVQSPILNSKFYVEILAAASIFDLAIVAILGSIDFAEARYSLVNVFLVD